MSWHFSRALVEGYLDGSSSGGARYVASKLIRMQLGALRSGRTTGFYRLSPSGTTLPRSMENLGGALLTWFREDSRARTSRWPVSPPGSMVGGLDCGRKWPESLAKYDRDSRSWRTRQLSLLADFTECLETFPNWGTMRSGECWARTTPSSILETRRRITSANGSGSLPTPRNNTGPTRTGRHKSLDGVVHAIPTPTVHGNYNRKGLSATSGDGLATWVAAQPVVYPPPQAHKVTESGEIVNADGSPWDGCSKPHSKTSGRPITTALADAVKWATPCAMEPEKDVERWEEKRNRPRSERGGGHGMNLATQVIMFPTPIASEARQGVQIRRPGKKGTQESLTTIVQKLDGLLGLDPASTGGVETPRMTLNPAWVEWLMGWPIGWTDLRPLAMDRYRQWWRLHGGH